LIIVMESAPMLIAIHAPPDVHSLEIAAVRYALFEANQYMRSGDRYDLCLVAAAPPSPMSRAGRHTLIGPFGGLLASALRVSLSRATS
jgi:hypothetical protein